MSSGGVIGGFAAAFGTAAALGIIGITVHVCQYQPNARSRLYARRRSFIERSRQNHVFSINGTESKGLELEDIECFCPQLRYLGPDKEPALVLPHDRTTVCLSDWLEQKQRQLEEDEVRLNMDTSGDNSHSSRNETKSQRNSQSGLVNHVVDSRSSRTSRSQSIHHAKSSKRVTCPLLVGRDVVSDEICAICLDTVEADSLIRVVKCGHAFHSSCIIHWLASANRCPLCNTAAVSEEDKSFMELRRSAHGATSPSVWPFPKPNLSKQDVDDCLFRSLEVALKEVQSRYGNQEQAV